MIIWLPEALLDLKGIHKYLLQKNSTAAARLIDNIKKDVSHLEQFPKMGKVDEAFRNKTIRYLLISGYKVFYRLKDGDIIITGVFHSTYQYYKKDISKLL